MGIAQFHWMGQGAMYRGASNGCDLGCCTGGKPPCLVETPHATVFPQGTGVAATFDLPLVFSMGEAIAAESRALQSRFDRRKEYRTGASSVINIARDGRWGRVAETYGECPALTGRTAIALNKALLGFRSPSNRTRPAVYKTIPVTRHFAAYAGPDRGRFQFDAQVGAEDLFLTHLAAWREMLDEGALPVVMSAISAVNGAPGIANEHLLNGERGRCYGFLTWHARSQTGGSAWPCSYCGGGVVCLPPHTCSSQMPLPPSLLPRSSPPATPVPWCSLKSPLPLPPPRRAPPPLGLLRLGPIRLRHLPGPDSLLGMGG